MAINITQFEVFCNSWLRKARLYQRPIGHFATVGDRRYDNVHQATDTVSRNLARSFDRFTSLYVVYNRVYVEAAKLLVRRGLVCPPSKKFSPLPDLESATGHLVTFYGERALQNAISRNPRCSNAVDYLTRLIQNGHIYLHEDYETGLPAVKKDLALANKASRYDPKAILSLIYRARCNLFHGEKDFDGRQSVFLDNLSVILEFVTITSLAKLKDELRRE
jgi:hypothetical protein